MTDCRTHGRGTADIYPGYENILLDFPIGDDPSETYSRSILIQVTVALTVNCAPRTIDLKLVVNPTWTWLSPRRA